MNRLILAFCLCLGGLTQAALGCSLAVASLSKFDNEEFIFIGTVRGYTDSVRSKPNVKKTFETTGLIVEVKESVFLPQTPGSRFEVFPIQLWADCTTGGTSLENLKRDFPVGIELRIIAKKAKIVPASPDPAVIRLEDRPGIRSLISRNIHEEDRRITSASSYFDYKAFDYHRYYAAASPSMLGLPAFEVRKDLLRLRNSATQAERNVILSKFLSVLIPDSDLSLTGVLHNYASSKAEALRLDELHMKTFMPEYYEEYMAWQNAKTELYRMGYKKGEVKKALKKALSECTCTTTEETVSSTLKYLPARMKN